MNNPSHHVWEYSEKRLREALSSFGLLDTTSPYYVQWDSVILNQRSEFYNGYLTSASLGVKWIVVEYSYTDGDYLDDYVWFYARCFREYARKCKRIHFFGELPFRLDEESLAELIMGRGSQDDLASFKDAYRGFLIVRPLPRALVGRTLLRPYGPSRSPRFERAYLSVTDYRVNLFGLELSVLSLPFQEQDSVVSACATVSLWTCLGQAARVFGVTVPKPAQISMLGSPSRKGRAIPSSGLNLLEVCAAIRETSLEAEVFEMPDGPDDSASYRWLSIIYAYLHAKLPVFLGVDCVEGGVVTAKHAIAVSGFERILGTPQLRKEHPHQRDTAVKMQGLRIHEIYAHDDQLGPFARFFVNLPRGIRKDIRLQQTDPMERRTNTSEAHYRPRAIVVPVYSKIRVSFHDVEAWVSGLDDLVRETASFPKDIEWDVVLTDVSDLKRDLRARLPDGPGKLRRLIAQWPRFLWHVRLLGNQTDLLELVIDATDSAKGAHVCDCISHDGVLWEDLKQNIESVLEDVVDERLFLEALLLAGSAECSE